MTRFIAAFAVTLACGIGAFGLDEPITRGAKEMFFDPADGEANAVVPRQQEKAPSEQSAKREAKPVYDDAGRRIPLSLETGANRSMGLSYWIELVDPSRANRVEATSDRSFRSGERIRLHFRSNADGRLVIVQLGSSGTSSLLFPDSGKGVVENTVRSGKDQVIPSEKLWFKFDDNVGTETLLVLFARTEAELRQAFPIGSTMDANATAALLRAADAASGSKDLFIETETRRPAELGTYAVNVAGKPVVLKIRLRHQ